MVDPGPRDVSLPQSGVDHEPNNETEEGGNRGRTTPCQVRVGDGRVVVAHV